MTTLADYDYKAPFVYFGAKSAIADEVWRRFGNVPNYVEPFFGSGAILLHRPHEPGIETVNDADGLVCNAWRALRDAPDEVAKWGDMPAMENQLHAIHSWLVQRKDGLQSRLEGDVDWYDARSAGYWLYGMACWIGGEFCSGKGSWVVVDGELVKRDKDADETGVKRQLLHLGTAGRGIQRKRLHLGDAGQDDEEYSLRDYFYAIADRMKRVRVCCGDWVRVTGKSVTYCNGLTGAFLDPPYSAEAGRNNGCYRVESATVAHDVRAWCLENGENPLLRIAICGYADEGHDMLTEHGWNAYSWKTQGGYANRSDDEGSPGRKNSARETVWFSPHCIKPEPDSQQSLFRGDTP